MKHKHLIKENREELYDISEGINLSWEYQPYYFYKEPNLDENNDNYTDLDQYNMMLREVYAENIVFDDNDELTEKDESH